MISFSVLQERLKALDHLEANAHQLASPKADTLKACLSFKLKELLIHLRWMNMNTSPPCWQMNILNVEGMNIHVADNDLEQWPFWLKAGLDPSFFWEPLDWCRSYAGNTKTSSFCKAAQALPSSICFSCDFHSLSTVAEGQDRWTRERDHLPVATEGVENRCLYQSFMVLSCLEEDLGHLSLFESSLGHSSISHCSCTCSGNPSPCLWIVQCSGQAILKFALWRFDVLAYGCVACWMLDGEPTLGKTCCCFIRNSFCWVYFNLLKHNGFKFQAFLILAPTSEDDLIWITISAWNYQLIMTHPDRSTSSC